MKSVHWKPIGQLARAGKVGASYFDGGTQAIGGGNSSITALKGSTEEGQFEDGTKEGAQAVGEPLASRDHP